MEGQLATIRGVDDALAWARGRADQLELSRQTIDRLAGFTAGLASKYLSSPPVRGFTLDSFVSMAAALGAVLLVAEDPQAIDYIKRKAERRAQFAVRADRSAGILGKRESRRILKYLAALGGKASRARLQGDPARHKQISSMGGRARRKALTRAQRVELARQAAQVRWERARARQRHAGAQACKKEAALGTGGRRRAASADGLCAGLGAPSA
jgi:hypothetical protein